MAKYVFNDHDGDSSNDAAHNNSISLWTGGATRGNQTDTYLFTDADVGKVLVFNVKARSTSGVTGNFARLAVAEQELQPPLDVAIHTASGGELIGNPIVGQLLEAKPSCQGTCDPLLQYQWKIQTLGSTTFEAIPGASARIFRPKAEHQRRALKVTVTKNQEGN